VARSTPSASFDCLGCRSTSTQSSSSASTAGAFRDLTSAELTEIAAFGTERAIAAGEMLFAAGEASFDLFVVLDGIVEVVNGEGEDAVVIVSYGRGGFVGELNLLTGQRRSLGCRVMQPGRVLVVSEEQFRRLMSGRPELAETIFNALLARREILREGVGAEAIRIVGSRFSPEAMSLRSFAEHSHLAHA
jgi:thioredoxin reductase (NADPH)